MNRIIRPSKDKSLRRRISDMGFVFYKGDSSNLMAAHKRWQGKGNDGYHLPCIHHFLLMILVNPLTEYLPISQPAIAGVWIRLHKPVAHSSNRFLELRQYA